MKVFVMLKIILLLTSAVFLTSTGYAMQPRDQAARSFQHRLDTLQSNNENSENQGQDNNNNQNSDDNNGDNNQGDQQENDENNNSQDQNNNNQSNDITPEQKLEDLTEDMKSVMLHLDRLDRKIAAIEKVATHKEKAATHKEKATAKKHKNAAHKQKKAPRKKHKKKKS